MWHYWFRRLKLFDVTVFCIAAGTLGYFIWQAENGPRSISYQTEILARQKSVQAELEEWRNRHEKVAARVDMMRPESVDADLLDELARLTLGVAAPNEFIVPLR